jgi:hypothetical protein
LDELIKAKRKFQKDLLNNNLEDVMENINTDEITPFNEISKPSKVCVIAIQKHDSSVYCNLQSSTGANYFPPDILEKELNLINAE